MLEAFEGFVQRVRQLPTFVQYLVAFLILFTLCSCCWLVVLLSVPISEEQMEAPGPVITHVAGAPAQAVPAGAGSSSAPPAPFLAQAPGRSATPAGERQQGRETFERLNVLTSERCGH